MLDDILKQRLEKNIRFLNVEEHENYHKDGLHERWNDRYRKATKILDWSI